MLKPKFEREIEDGWDNRFIYFGRVLVAWGTTVPGEPWEGPWIGLHFGKGKKGGRFVRFGVRGFACALGIAK